MKGPVPRMGYSFLSITDHWGHKELQILQVVANAIVNLLKYT